MGSVSALAIKTYNPDMKFDPIIHHRRSIRLKEYDYAQPGGYFVTIVTYHRDLLFGDIVNGELTLNGYGIIADECWRAIPDHFANVELGAHVVMPNHVHGVIVITEIGMATNSSPFVGARHASPLPPRGVKPKSIGAIVGSFKSAVTRRIGREHNASGIWQRNYYERIIRDDREMDRIHRYIESNPSMWTEDDENPNG
jgi:REP element-mobilizing transposase RayT